jgi:transcriptional regulator with XRE-family HTH domain
MPTGEQIRAGRALAGVSQTELADLAGVSRSAVARLELKQAATRSDTVEALERALARLGVELTTDGGVTKRPPLTT